jgi:pilus assembly protein FimV
VPAKPEEPDLDLSSLTLDLNELTAPVTVQGRASDTTLDFSNFGASEAAALDDKGDTAPAALADLDAADLSDPLARKLELADEFRQIGDMEGARDLLEEVVDKATGAMRARAQAMLDSLD